ncbi:MAG: hypothetical protein IT531_03465 [Burkholderiales bacterium]|nr:hypothetical protein [Burkholderiales bacterium]
MLDRRMLGRLLCYGVCGIALAYCSVAPSYQQLPPDTALLRLSMTLDGARLKPCRRLSAEELARLPANMRHAESCPRERADVRVRLIVDGELMVDETLPPRGLARDGAATLYRRLPLAAGTHRIEASVADDARRNTSPQVVARTVSLRAGQVLTIDFDREVEGVLFR